MRISDFIICDDIRLEQFNKISLMGLYNDRIAIVAEKKTIKWPFVISLGLYIRIESPEEKIPSDFKFKITFLMNDKELGGLEGNGRQATSSIAIIPAKVPQFPITEAGNLKFILSLRDNSGTEVCTHTQIIKVEVTESSERLN